MKSRSIRKRTGLVLDVVFISLGILSATFGLKSFLIPNGFIDGGVTGISLLITSLSPLDLSYLILLINIPFVILGYRQIGKVFAVKTGISILILALAIHFIPFEPITDDKLLIAIFGGVFLGAGVGLAMRGESVIDGTEVLALYISRNSSLSVGTTILLLNIIIFAFAAILRDIEIALYAILTYVCATKTVDFIVNGIEQYTGVTVISDKNAEIKVYITEHMKRGVTFYKGSGGYHSDNQIDILFTILTRLEIAKLQAKIDEIDPTAFVYQQQIADLKGGIVKKHVLH